MRVLVIGASGFIGRYLARRLVERGGLVEGTGQYDEETGGRPAELFAFRREVLRERAAPGVRLPGPQARI